MKAFYVHNVESSLTTVGLFVHVLHLVTRHCVSGKKLVRKANRNLVNEQPFYKLAKLKVLLVMEG